MYIRYVYSRELIVSGNVVAVYRHGEGTGITVGRSRALVRVRAVACPVLHHGIQRQAADRKVREGYSANQVKSRSRCVFILSASRLDRYRL